jgi:hypothetical protein
MSRLLRSDVLILKKLHVCHLLKIDRIRKQTQHYVGQFYKNLNGCQQKGRNNIQPNGIWQNETKQNDIHQINAQLNDTKQNFIHHSDILQTDAKQKDNR